MRTWKSCAEEGIALYKCCRFHKAEELFVESVRRARNDNAAPAHLAESLNNLSIAYFARAKFQDAETALREACELTRAHRTDAEFVQRLLTAHIRSQIALEQERFESCHTESTTALNSAVNNPRLSAEFWFNLARSHLGLGQRTKAIEAVDRFLSDATTANEFVSKVETAGTKSGADYSGPVYPEPVYSDPVDSAPVYPDPVYYDPVTSCTFFGPGWESNDVPKTQLQVEAEIRALLLRASLNKLHFSLTRKYHNEALELCEQLGDHYLTAETYFVAGRRAAFTDHDWVAASKYCREALEIVERIFGESHPIVPIYLLNRVCLSGIGDALRDYEALMNRALTIIDTTFGARHPKRARYQLMYCSLMPMANPGDTDFNSRQEAAANEALEAVMDFFEDTHSLVLAARLQIAEILNRQQRFSESAEILEKLLADSATLVDTQPHHIIGCISELLNLAEQLPDIERYELWELAINSISKIDISDYSDDPGRQVDLYRSTAYVHIRTNSADAAEELLNKAYKLAQSFDADLARDCKDDLVTFHQRTNNHRRALELLEQEEPGASLHYRMSQNVRRADLLHDLERGNEAEELALKCLSETEQYLPELIDSFLNFFRILFTIYLENNRLDDAVRMLGTLSVQKEHAGIAARDLLPNLLILLAEQFGAQGDQRAEKYFSQAIHAAGEVQGRSPQILDRCYSSFADYCVDTGQFEKAYKLNCTALRLREEMYGKDNYWTAVGMLRVAELCVESDFDKAMQLSERALEIIDVEPTRDEDYLLAALQVRAYVLQRSSQREEAIIYAERARELEKKLTKNLKQTL